MIGVKANFSLAKLNLGLGEFAQRLAVVNIQHFSTIALSPRRLQRALSFVVWTPHRRGCTLFNVADRVIETGGAAEITVAMRSSSES